MWTLLFLAVFVAVGCDTGGIAAASNVPAVSAESLGVASSVHFSRSLTATASTLAASSDASSSGPFSAPASFTSLASSGASGSSLPSSSTLASAAIPTSGNSTSNGTVGVPSQSTSSSLIDGYEVQPSPDPAAKHTFVPFPTVTQEPVSGVFVPVDPSNPPPPSSDPQILPDFESAWNTAAAKAKALVAAFSLEQKVNVSTGVGNGVGRCIGNTPPIPEFNFPGFCLEDSPLGVRQVDFATLFPTGINTAATWQRSLMRQRGIAMGQEHKGKGVNVALGPMMNMGRVAAGGRNFEGFGADPFLSGETAYETVLGMQQGGVQATAKHYINNDQETDRTTETSNVDDRTEHEIYAHPFLRSVMAGVAAFMCSYNQINHTYACENDKTLNQMLKGEFGFRGYVMSDWGGTHSTLGALYGLDMTMPGDINGPGTSYFGPNLTAYVLNGSIPESRVNDMAERIISAWYFLHQDSPSYPTPNFNANNPVDAQLNLHVDVQDDHADIVRSIGAASAILLKNVNNTLPLKKPRSIALIGSDAGPAPGGPNQFRDLGGVAGTLACGWGSGTANYTYLVDPLQAIQARARQDRTTVNWHLDDFDLDGAGNIAIQADHALVFINADSGEGYITVDGNTGDRKNLTAWHGGDDLVLAVAAQNSKTIVVIHSVGPLILEPWVEHPNVTAIVWAGLPGTESGNGLVDMLYGAVNPSARLPFTLAKNASDYIPVTPGGADPITTINYSEGLLIDYRHFDALGIDPRFEFGFGLSYTTFAYSSLSVSEIGSSFAQSTVNNWKASKPSPTGEGSSTAAWLHEPTYRVSFNVKNTGTVNGTEIPQIYVHHPTNAGEPPSVLKGFTDVFLDPGQTKKVSITLSRYDLSIWDVVSQSWVRPRGTIGLTVGASSRDGRLSGRIPS